MWKRVIQFSHITKFMIEAVETRKGETAKSELDLPLWSVVSFDKCEASGLTYAAAAKLMIEKEAAGVYGLCIITDDAAANLADGCTQSVPPA